MKRVLVLLFGLVSYAIFFATFLYAIGFVGNLVVPKSIDSGTEESLPLALGVDVVLLGLFAVQHSIMARPAFKKWWTQFVPQAIERSIFVLVASGILILMYWLWKPIPAVIWHVENEFAKWVLYGVFAAGWLIVLVSTFLIDHFDLFGVRQVVLYFRNKPYEHISFRAPGLYRFVRHPIMLGFIIAFWATPHMTAGHLLFAFATTAYILIAIQLEERDLVTYYGDAYRKYKQQVGMLFPWRSNNK